MNKQEHYTNAKAVIGFLIVALGCAVLLLFKNNKDVFLRPETSRPFFFLLFAGAALFIGLFYLVSQAESTKPKKVVVKAKKTAAKKKK